MKGYKKLGRNSAHRKSMLRNLVTDLFREGRITTTDMRAKEAGRQAEKLITIAKKGDLHARRQASKFIFDVETSKFMDRESGEVFDAPQEGKKLMPQTVLRKLFSEIGKKYADRNGGYTRIYHLPPRRGDAAEMALIQLVD